MILSSKINDTYTASQEWLRRRLEIDEILLPDYNRPLKLLPRSMNPFTSEVIKKAFASAVYQAKCLLP